MATWAGLQQEAPEIAAEVRRRFAVRKHATLATLRADGSPRISGSEVEFGDIAGRALETTDPQASATVPHSFRLDVTEAVITWVDGEELVVRSWHEGRGEQTVRRR